MTRVRHSLWNIASGMAFMVLTVGIGIFTTPWLLRWLGQDRYGAWRVISDAFAYLALLDLGFGGAVIGFLAPALANRDSVTVESVIASSLGIYRTITLLSLAGGLLLLVLLPRLLPQMREGELRLACAILILPVLWTFANVFRALAEARQQNYLVTLLLMAQSLVITGLSLLAAKMDGKLPGQAAASAVGLSLPAIFLIGSGLRRYPSCASAKSAGSMSAALWKLSWPTLISNLSGRAGLMSDNIVIGWAVGPAMVAPFYLTQRLVMLAQLQLQGIGNGTWAGLVELHEREDVATFRARLLELTGLVSGFGLAILGPIAAFNQQFVQQWLGLDSYAGDAITLLACLNAWLWSVFSLWGWPLTGTGKVAAWAPYSLAFLVINLVVSIVGALRYGMVGPLLGTLMAFVSVNLWAMPLVLKRCFGIRSGCLLRAAGKPLLCGIPYAVMVWLIAHSYATKGWIALGLQLGVAVSGGIAVWYFTAVSRNDRKVWRARFAALLFEDRKAVDPGSVVSG